MFTVEEKIQKARAGLILDHPFFGALALKLRLEADPNIETGCTNGKRIRYNPQWTDNLNLPAVKGFLAHEVLHCSSAHHARRGQRDPKKWNMAGDYVINQILINAGLTLPEGALIDPAFAGMSTDEVYSRLPDPPPDRGGQGDGPPDPGKCGGVEDGPGTGTEAEQAEQEQEWKINTIQAAQAARMQGNLPADIARIVDAWIRPVVNWQEQLRAFVETAAKNDYDWTRPSGRYISQGIYLPRIHSLELGEIAVFIDTSGSISQDDMDQFSCELTGILEAYDNVTAHVAYIDATVCGSDRFESQDLPLELHPVGGGGTRFGPAFEWVEEQGLAPKCAVYLTDLYGSFPDVAPDYPVLWCIKGGCTTEPPFGEAIHID